MRLTQNIFFALILMLLYSCSGMDQIRVEEVRNVKVQPFKGNALEVALEARVNNPSCRKVQLTKLELNVEQGSSVLATISTTDKITVPGRSNAFQQIPIEIRLRNMMSFLMTVQQKNFSIDELTLEGELQVKAFPMSKKIKIEKQSIKDFTAQYGDFITPLLNMRSR